MRYLLLFKRNYKLIILLVAFTPTVLKSNGTVPTPFSDFRIVGKVESSGGEPVVGVPVVLLVMIDTGRADSLETFEIYVPTGGNSLGSKYLDTTNIFGDYWLNVKTHRPILAMSPAVMSGDSLVTGDTLFVSDLKYQETTIDAKSKSGDCCGDDVWIPMPYSLSYASLIQDITIAEDPSGGAVTRFN